MSPLLVLATLTAPFHFSGGSEVQLAAALAEHLNKPVTIFCSASSFMRTSIRYEREEDLKRSLTSLFRLEGTRETWGLAPKSWPRSFFDKQNIGANYVSQFSSGEIECKASGDSVTTLRSQSAISLSDLAGALSDAKIEWHPFFDESRLVVDGSDCTVKEVLASTADALGAKLIDKEGQYKFELDPQAYRRRTLAMCAAGAWRFADDELFSVGERADLNYLSVLVKNLTDTQIMRFMDPALKSNGIKFSVTQPVHKAAMGRARAHLEMNRQGAAEGRIKGVALDLMSSIQPNAPVWARLRPDGAIECEYLTLNNSRLGF